MGKKEKNNQAFFDKMRFKYRVSVLDENTLEESWHVRLSRLSLFLYACVFVLITFFILAILIFITPLRYYLPGYGDEGNRETVISESMRADSLQSQMDKQIAYMNIIRDVIAGNLDTADIKPLDSIVIIDKKDEPGIEQTERERKFIERFEEEEKYNLSSLGYRPKNDSYVLFKPVNGVIQQHFNAIEQIYGISILTPPNEKVLSVLDGTVIYADYSFNNGWIIQVQHEGNYISVYKNNIRLLKKVGEIVHAGENIAIAGNASEQDQLFEFELWNNGNAVNPEYMIIF